MDIQNWSQNNVIGNIKKFINLKVNGKQNKYLIIKRYYMTLCVFELNHLVKLRYRIVL